jgi:GNAT superfamily N-acetyltransferase
VPRPSLDVRRAGPEDVEDLLGLWLEARREVVPLGRSMLVGSPETARPLLVQALQAREVEILLAHLDRRPAGFVIIRTGRLTPMCESSVLEIDHLFVTRELRRHGVGRALLAGVAAEAERRGAEQVVSNAAPMARDTQRFFARLGFSPLVTLRAAPTGTLVRRLAGTSRTGAALEDLISRRRRLRARGAIAALQQVREAPVPAPPTVELPLIPEPQLVTPIPPSLESPLKSPLAAPPM